jgi:hypothetical protein
MSLNYSDYYKKVANREPLSEDEIVALLKHAQHFEQVAAYLAGCHAASAEGLPRSTSKFARGRMLAICQTAAKALRGDISAIRYPSKTEHEIERCERVAEELQRDTQLAAERKAKSAPNAGGM